ncbi:triple functional domain protein-like isoform X1 [Festucalex cinctus]
MARRITDIFLKYLERDGVKMGMQSHDDSQKEEVQKILACLLEREDRVLHLWNMRESLEQCQSFVAFVRRAKQLLGTIQDMSEVYLSTGSRIHKSRRELLKDREDLHIIAKIKDPPPDVIPATSLGSNVKLRDNTHKVNEEKRKCTQKSVHHCRAD